MPETRNNQRDWKNIKIIIEIISIALLFGITWATVRGNVKENTEDIREVKIAQRESDERVITIVGDVREIRVRQEVMAKGIENINEKLK